MPASLGEHGRARWVEIWTGPAKAWLEPAVDLIRVATVCHLTDDVAEFRRLITGMGPVLLETVILPTGQPTGEKKVVPNPVVRMLRDAERNLDRELTVLALDPISRHRSGVTEPVPAVPGTDARAAAEATIAALRLAGRLEPIDSARVAALLALADAVDHDRASAALWREFRAADDALREVPDDDDDEFAALLGSLSASVGHPADRPADHGSGGSGGG